MLQARNGFEQLALTGARNTGNTEYFTGTGGKGDIVQNTDTVAIKAVQTVDNEPVLTTDGFGAFNIKRDLLAHHHFGKLRFACFGGIDAADIFALAKHGNAVGK